MKTELIIIWANIKSKKLQSIALSLVFMAVSILFFMSIQLFGATGEYETLFTESITSQGLIYVNGDETKDIIVDFLEEHEDIFYVNSLANYDEIIETNIQHESELIPIPDAFLTELSSNVFDQIKIIEGKTADELLENELIFSYGKSELNNVVVGDTVIFNTEHGIREMIIAGIGVDLTYNFDTITLNRFWTSKTTIDSFGSTEENYSLGITYKEYSEQTEQDIMDELEVVLGERSSDVFILPFSLILSANSFFQVIIGAIFSFIGVILIVVGLFIIRSIIFNNIITESKKIATLKSTGFSSRDIISMYELEYGVIALISIVLGFIASLVLNNVVLGDLNELNNMFGIASKINFIQVIIALIVILLIIELTVYLVARKVSQIKPAVALSRGAQGSESKAFVSVIKYKFLPISLVLAVKDIFYSKKTIITLALFIIATAFTVVTLSSVSYSISSQKDNIHLWLGYDVDAKIISSEPMNLESYQETIAILESSQYVSGTVAVYNDLNSQIYDSNQKKFITSISQIFVTDEKESLEFSVLEGRLPENENEIMLGNNLLSSLEIEIGDYATVRSLGEELDLLVVGECQSMTNQGMTFRLFYDEMKSELLTSSLMYINFTDGIDRTVLEDEVDMLLDYNATLVFEEPNASMVSMLGILDIVVSGVIGIFAIISLVVLLNLNLTNVNKERFNYGIYKSIGMNNNTIVNIYLLKNSIINVFGLLIGWTMGILILPTIVNSITKTLGLTEYPTSIQYFSLIVAFTIVFSVTLLNAVIIKRIISKITPKELLIE